jgi:cytochrome c peroxidase
MLKKTVTVIGIATLAILSFPLSNLLRHTDTNATDNAAQIQDPAFQKAVPILQNKCLDCHSSQARIPFYANFPIARDLIQKDMTEGIARFNLSGKLENEGKNFTELDLARLEGTLLDHSMPPLRYVALHWDAKLSAGDEQALRDWINALRSSRNLGVKGVHSDFAREPFQPLPLNVNVDPEKVALGKALFHDTRLSGDGTLSCASCHALNKGGTDRLPVSVGIRGQKGPINSPTVFNAAYNIRQFWDGRAADLKEQAGGPVTNPLEMGATWPEVLAKLNQDSTFLASFQRAYPDGLSADNIQDAIATFEQTLITPNAKFDRYLRGDKTAISSVALKGYQLFKSNCASCHSGMTLGGLSFEKMGRRKDYFSARGGKLNDADLGLYNFTQKEADKHFFKVPTLRNVAQTAPYFHDASAKTLEDAVRVMGKYQAGKNFSEQEVTEITAFLHTLTGEYEGRLLE